MTSTKEQILEVLADKNLTPRDPPVYRPTSEKFKELEEFKAKHSLTDPQMSAYCGVGVSTLTSWRQRFKTKAMFKSEGTAVEISERQANEKLIEDILDYFKSNVSEDVFNGLNTHLQDVELEAKRVEIQKKAEQEMENLIIENRLKKYM